MLFVGRVINVERTYAMAVLSIRLLDDKRKSGRQEGNDGRDKHDDSGFA